MGAWVLPPCDPDGTQRRLYAEHRVEVVVHECDGRPLLGVPVAPDTDAADLERLAVALERVL